MATWVDVYDAIQFQVLPYNEIWAIWRVRLLKGKTVFKTLVYPSADKEKLEKDAVQIHRASATCNSLYQ